jgi:predicted TIM-barrel fold metal-dependent hydrolase
MSGKIADRIQVIDTDTHIIEPKDLWTSRVAKKWVDKVPRVTRYPGTEETGFGMIQPGDEVWVIGDHDGSRWEGCMSVGAVAMAGWPNVLPHHPHSLDEVDPSLYDAQARLRKMDEYGIHAQVLFPNVGGFGFGRFLELDEPELMLACVEAYNNFLSDWTSAAPDRFVPLMALPFWDMDATVREIERAAALGHKGITFTHAPESFGAPFMGEPYWRPLWERAQDMELSINFHIGNGNFAGSAPRFYVGNGTQINYSKSTATLFLGNAQGILEVISSGVAHRYPNLRFVSVESGIGWIPFVLSALQWQWDNSGVHAEHPEYDLTPKEYFLRQIYGCFWFEDETAKATLELLGADNFMFETDFPHPTSLSPGPASTALNPIEHIETHLGQLSEDVLHKVLHDNAARLYHLD